MLEFSNWRRSNRVLEAENSTLVRSAIFDLCDLKFGMLPPEVPPTTRVQHFESKAHSSGHWKAYLLVFDCQTFCWAVSLNCCEINLTFTEPYKS